VTLIAFNKPYLVHCKFTDDAGRPTLAAFGLPPRVYVAGRLDHDSEGLLLLTDDGKLNQRITDPRWKAAKTYLAHVEGTITEEALAKLRAGVTLKDGPTLPAQARAVDPPTWLWPRTPPIRVRKTVPDAFLELVIREGRNRQDDRECRATDATADSHRDRRMHRRQPGTRRLARGAYIRAGNLNGPFVVDSIDPWIVAIDLRP
jgi:23S rRNA pseudouridine2457 synthase